MDVAEENNSRSLEGLVLALDALVLLPELAHVALVLLICEPQVSLQLLLVPLDSLLFEPLVTLTLGVRMACMYGGLAAVHEQHLVACEPGNLFIERGNLCHKVAARMRGTRVFKSIAVVDGEEDATDAGYNEAVVLLRYKAEIRNGCNAGNVES